MGAARAREAAREAAASSLPDGSIDLASKPRSASVERRSTSREKKDSFSQLKSMIEGLNTAED
eukprot:CAMPEP_0114153658 /NCGR_PEP_ID=MMETSP0043_2-20121206/24482_1 /TAXON_ID=464988 /ORGANISM="Hemiselmis andersenii, Strain CCMP644" /LENGTH=62 /DNA_ID=CAMNT_0001248727 /DNA_START=38 /DNA_END=223 /DNA_ORIENTATION=-